MQSTSFQENKFTANLNTATIDTIERHDLCRITAKLQHNRSLPTSSTVAVGPSAPEQGGAADGHQQMSPTVGGLGPVELGLWRVGMAAKPGQAFFGAIDV